MDRIKVRVVYSGFFNPVFGKADTCPIDQMPSKSFNLDPYSGRPMEEITKVMRAQTAAEQQTAYLNLAQFKGDFLPDDTSAKTALKFMKPSLCQLPSELAEWSEYISSQELSRLEKERADKQEEDYLAELKKQLEEGSTTPAVSDGNTN